MQKKCFNHSNLQCDEGVHWNWSDQFNCSARIDKLQLFSISLIIISDFVGWKKVWCWKEFPRCHWREIEKERINDDDHRINQRIWENRRTSVFFSSYFFKSIDGFHSKKIKVLMISASMPIGVCAFLMFICSGTRSSKKVKLNNVHFDRDPSSIETKRKENRTSNDWMSKRRWERISSKRNYSIVSSLDFGFFWSLNEENEMRNISFLDRYRNPLMEKEMSSLAILHLLR